MGYSHTRCAQFVSKRGVNHSSRDNHAANTHGGDSLGPHVTSIVAVDHAALQDADHGGEYCLESALGAQTTARNICRQCHHGTRVLYVVKMLSREIRADNLRADVGGGQLHFDAPPAVFPVGIGEETSKNSRVQIAFAFEVTIEATMRQSRTSHNLLQRNIIKAAAIK